MAGKKPILVSACLLGVNCRYDGTNNLQQRVMDYLDANNLLPVPICPEQLGGLPTPRGKVWFTRGDGRGLCNGAAQLTDERGENPAAAFLRGARETLKIAQSCRCKTAILKERSPSCGSTRIHRNGKLTDGVGITCALLQQAGLQVFSEENLY
jgi:uncharacterized protein YbbK (DUF523 family)